VLVQYMTGNGNDQSERVVEVARFLSPLSAAAERFVVSSFVRSFVHSFVVVDARLRAEREMEREFPGLTGRPVSPCAH